MTLPTRRRSFLALILLAALLLTGEAARAQTPDQLFDDKVLHVVKLYVHSGDWERLKAEYTSNTYYPADIEWAGVRVRNVGIRSRGLASRNEFKPGLRVDANRYAQGQTFLGMRSLILDNVYRDVSMIKERVAMKMFARFGIPAPREAHATLYVNNQYVGVYVITEELGEDFVRRAFRKPDSDEPDKGTLFEYHWVERWDFSYLGPELERYERMFEARTHENDPFVELYSPIEELVRTVNEHRGDTFVDAADRLIDLRQFVTYLAVENFMVEHDGFVGYAGMANFYLYRPEGSRRSLLVPWDKDQTFHVANRDIGHGLGDNVLVRRAIAVPELRKVYLDTLAACARFALELEDGEALPWLEREVTRAARQIHDAALADPHRWFGTEDFENEIERLIEFARTRPQFVACQVENARNEPAPAKPCSAPSNVAPR